MRLTSGAPASPARLSADVVVIGGGIIGLATAYKLLGACPGMNVLVLEKEQAVGSHQSGHNSGVLHAGLSYLPGSAKARLATGGIRQMTAFCRNHGVPHKICGKLVVATETSEIPALRELQRRGTANGLLGLEWLDGVGIAAYEPHATGVAALRVPEEGIVDFPEVCRTLAREITAGGGEVMTSTRVVRLEWERSGWTVETTKGELRAGAIVTCAGLQADRLARGAGARVGLRIIPFRGQYFAVCAERAHLVNGLIYPVPDLSFPFLGVHLTRTVHGTVAAGPTAMVTLAREGYHWSAVSPRDLQEIGSFPGLWRFLGRHPRTCWNQARLSFSRSRFAAAARRLVPALEADDFVPAGAGVRAQAMWPSGELAMDFLFAEGPSAVHLLNAPSPGATAALAIGDEIVRRLEGALPRPFRRVALDESTAGSMP